MPTDFGGALWRQHSTGADAPTAVLILHHEMIAMGVDGVHVEAREAMADARARFFGERFAAQALCFYDIERAMRDADGRPGRPNRTRMGRAFQIDVFQTDDRRAPRLSENAERPVFADAGRVAQPCGSNDGSDRAQAVVYHLGHLGA